MVSPLFDERAAALPGLGGRPPGVRRRPRRGPARVPARAGHDGRRAGRSCTATCGRQIAREGLIVDVRGNRGGHLSQLVLEKLARKIIGWDVVRHGQPATYPQRRPARAGRGGGERVLRLRRRHRHRRDQADRDRPGGRHPHLGRRDRHRRPLHAGRRHLWSPSRATPSGSTTSAGEWRTTASTRTSRSWSRRRTGSAGRDPQLERAVQIALASLAERPAATAARPGDPAVPGAPAASRPPAGPAGTGPPIGRIGPEESLTAGVTETRRSALLWCKDAHRARGSRPPTRGHGGRARLAGTFVQVPARRAAPSRPLKSGPRYFRGSRGDERCCAARAMGI